MKINQFWMYVTSHNNARACSINIIPSFAIREFQNFGILTFSFPRCARLLQ